MAAYLEYLDGKPDHLLLSMSRSEYCKNGPLSPKQLWRYGIRSIIRSIRLSKIDSDTEDLYLIMFEKLNNLRRWQFYFTQRYSNFCGFKLYRLLASKCISAQGKLCIQRFDDDIAEAIETHGDNEEEIECGADDYVNVRTLKSAVKIINRAADTQSSTDSEVDNVDTINIYSNSRADLDDEYLITVPDSNFMRLDKPIKDDAITEEEEKILKGWLSDAKNSKVIRSKLREKMAELLLDADRIKNQRVATNVANSTDVQTDDSFTEEVTVSAPVKLPRISPYQAPIYKSVSPEVREAMQQKRRQSLPKVLKRNPQLFPNFLEKKEQWKIKQKEANRKEIEDRAAELGLDAVHKHELAKREAGYISAPFGKPKNDSYSVASAAIYKARLETSGNNHKQAVANKLTKSESRLINR